MTDNTPDGHKPLAVYLLIVAVVTAAYWIVWFLIPGGQESLAAMPGELCHATFENAFLLADGWMAFCAAVASWKLFKRQPQAVAWLFMAGSAGAYLLGMDVLYDLQNGVYLRLTDAAVAGAVTTEILVNLGTLLFVVWSLRWAWRNSAWR